MKVRWIDLPVMLIVVLLIMASATAHAQGSAWGLQLTNASQLTSPNGTLTYSGTITNTTGAALHLTSSTVSFDTDAPSDSYSVDFADGFKNLGGVIPASGYTGPILVFSWLSDAPIGASGVGSVDLSVSDNVTPQSVADTFIAGVVSPLTLDPDNVYGGLTSTGTITLDMPAPNGGLVVNLSSDTPSAATVPASVTVQAGASTADFTVTTYSVPADTVVTISADYQNAHLTAALRVGLWLDELTTDSSSVFGGQTLTGTVTLYTTAPSAGLVVNLSSSNTSIATVPASVTVQPGSNSADFTISANLVPSDTDVTITASAGGAPLSVTVTVQSWLYPLFLSPNIVKGGQTIPGSVALRSNAPAGGFVVTLNSSNTSAATVPTIVTIPEGANSATFTVTTIPVASDTAVTISATDGAATVSEIITVQAPALNSNSLSPTVVKGGVSSTGTVTIDSPAPTNGLPITLISSDPTIATVPASVTVPAGAMQATYTVSTVGVTSDTVVTIRSTYATAVWDADLTVQAPRITTFTVSPSSVKGGVSSTGTITLDIAAPTGGMPIGLSSSNTAAASVPTTITVPAGMTTTTFTITTYPVVATRKVTLSAKSNGITKKVTLTVQAPRLLSLTVSPTTIKGGASATGTITLDSPAAAGATIQLASTSTAVKVSAKLTLQQGATTANFTIKSLTVSTQTVGKITATYQGGSKSADLTVQPPALTSLSLNPTTIKGGGSVTGTVTIDTPAPTSGFAITLSSSDTAVATVPGTVTVAGGKTQVNFTVSTTAVTANKSVTIKASANNISKSATLTVTP